MFLASTPSPLIEPAFFLFTLVDEDPVSWQWGRRRGRLLCVPKGQPWAAPFWADGNGGSIPRGSALSSQGVSGKWQRSEIVLLFPFVCESEGKKSQHCRSVLRLLLPGVDSSVSTLVWDRYRTTSRSLAD